MGKFVQLLELVSGKFRVFSINEEIEFPDYESAHDYMVRRTGKDFDRTLNVLGYTEITWYQKDGNYHLIH